MLNRPVGGELGRKIAEHFVEVVFAPEFDDEALEALETKPALRILRDRERRVDTPNERDYKRVVGGLLVQQRDSDVRGTRRHGGRRRHGHRGPAGTTCCSPGASAST